ncbi:FtsH protease activity modulator HflK [Elioraea sp.]|uniref:FtsH protease activity modulator HflK n=1 Tax=Elioraea sp. TaxID=2185103 RepID=UPI0021DD24C7|nr:FtsH protease activity modulator HflK [Elioraea sp.]GIX10457.1 MAG: protease modulator HflK [Elioraea sp.]
MPWTNNSGGGGPWGGGGRSGGPWGGGGGPSLPQPPNVDELLRKGQDFVRRFLPRGFGGGKGLAILGAILVGVWLFSGFYRVQPDEQGVVLRFGAFNRTTPPGLNYALPYPIETVTTPRVTRINRIDVGFRSPVEGMRPVATREISRDVPEESLMLTGDENIIDIDFAVFWRIRDAGEFLFNIRNPEQTVKSAAESVMREVIGRTPIQPALTEARAQIEQAVREGTQGILDQYRAGIEVAQVQLQKVDPPAAVIDAFRDVQRANADRERLRNEAEAFRNDIIPRARGEAERFVQEAQGDREGRIARARGEAERFTQILAAYSQARDVTRQRLYLETMEEILRSSPTVLVDDKVQNLVPFLPLNDLNRARQAVQPGSDRPQPLPSAPGGGLSAPSARITGSPR